MVTEPGATEVKMVDETELREDLGSSGGWKKRKLNAVTANETVVDQRKVINKLEKESVFDFLTGLHNKKYLSEQFDRADYERKRSSTNYAIGIIDVDKFKESANDTYGHDAGDIVLRELAGIISNDPKKINPNRVFRPDDETARVGGDEFAILLRNFSPDEDPTKKSKELELRINLALKYALGKYNSKFPLFREIGVSIGVAVPENDDNWDDVYKRADELMYKSKENKKLNR